MSMTVLIIGAAHAIPVFAAAAFSGGWGLTILAATGTTLFAFAIGGSKWVVFDLAGVGLGLFLAKSIISEHQRNRVNARPMPTSAPQTSSPPATEKKDESGLLVIVGIIIGVVVTIYIASTRSSEPGTKQAASESLATRHATPSAPYNQNHHAQANKMAPVQSPASHKSDVRDCLTLSTNQAIARCAERKK